MNKIFLSYRREDSADTCGRIYEWLVNRFGKEAVFKDVDSIPLGVAFPDYIASVIQQCAVQLVVIGPRFSDVTDSATGRPRLENPGDFVRIEVESGLARWQRRETIVVPVLVQGATMPDSRPLPASIRPLFEINGTAVRRDPDFAPDMRHLITQIERWLGAAPVPPAQHDSPPPPQPTPAPPPDPRAAQLRRLVDDAGAALAAGHFGDAVLKAELALTLPGGNTAEVRALLARAAAGSGRWQKARDAATRALADDPFAIPLWRLLADAHHHLNAPAEALTALDRAQALTPLSDTPTRLAILAERRAIQTEQQQWPAALATLEDELRLAPDDRARLETLADLQAKTNHPQDAPAHRAPRRPRGRLDRPCPRRPLTERRRRGPGRPGRRRPPHAQCHQRSRPRRAARPTGRAAAAYPARPLPPAPH